MSVWGWLRGLFANDRGFIVRNGKELRWARSTVVRVLVGPEAGRWMEDLERAAGTINQAVGRVLIGGMARVGLADIMRWMASGHGEGGTILVRADGAADNHGSAEPTWGRSGELHAVLVTLPERIAAGYEYPVVLHEMLHAVGLDHDRRADSIMWPQVRPSGQVILAGDVARLRKAYA